MQATTLLLLNISGQPLVHTKYWNNAMFTYSNCSFLQDTHIENHRKCHCEHNPHNDRLGSLTSCPAVFCTAVTNSLWCYYVGVILVCMWLQGDPGQFLVQAGGCSVSLHLLCCQHLCAAHTLPLLSDLSAFYQTRILCDWNNVPTLKSSPTVTYRVLCIFSQTFLRAAEKLLIRPRKPTPVRFSCDYRS